MGKRGEGWVIIQIVLILLILFAPRIPDIEFPLWLRGLGVVFMVPAAIAGAMSLVSLGRNLTPFPKPIKGGQLVTGGLYSILRHPLYAALILGAFGWSLFMSNLLSLVLSAGLFVLFDLKSRREEKWLEETYPDYPNYRKRVKKFIPWIY